jgi:hypothetical protein
MEKSGVGRLSSRISVKMVTTGSTTGLPQNRYANVESSLNKKQKFLIITGPDLKLQLFSPLRFESVLWIRGIRIQAFC